MVTLTVKQNRIGPVVGGHPWVFSQAFTTIPDGIPAGEPVSLVSERGEFLAFGYFSSYSQITVRIWGHDRDENPDEQFFTKRIERACELRKKYVETPETDSYRVVNGESDFLPGLIVDKYADYLAVQFHTKGIERWKKGIIDALQRVLNPKGIYERSDMPARKIEQTEIRTGLLAGVVPDFVSIRENGFTFLVDIKNGQKTGFFLDQRDKRKAVMKYAHDAAVLNCFSYTGGFSVYALAAGARRATSVDTSQAALDLARENVRVNGLDDKKCAFICEDVKRHLRNSTDPYDVIVLDPPAFIKDRRKKKEGIVGYKGINEAAVKLLSKDGLLVTCSCSTHLSPEEFMYLLSEAGGKTRRAVRFLEAYTHGIDHPVLVPFTEGQYLKCFIVSL